MTESSKVTNVLLAIIAVCLIIIAIKPAPILPDAAAQQIGGTTTDSRDRFAGITATTDKAAKEQIDAVRSVATAIESLAKATDNIARAIEQAGERTVAAPGAAAGATGGATLPPRR